MAIHVLGIRHHGPGSAKNVKAFLENLQPDIVLVEGPPDADNILQWATHAELKPPVAILCHQPENLQYAVFYPFAEFSPEWQAIQYARKKNIHLRFMDLPMTHQFAIEQQEKEKEKKGDANTDDIVPAINNAAFETDETATVPIAAVKKDPIGHLAAAAGYHDGEKWWEHMFEYRHNNEEIFTAVNEAMQVLRESLPEKEERREQLREAWMRKTIRQAEKEMFRNIAVVCGAWHSPALNNMPKQKEDNDLLKGLPKVKVECTWIPWTYNRLSFQSGYGAGIHSPGWYHHTWKHPNDDGTRWMAKVAKIFRSKKMDTSVAHVMEAVRLANALTSLRQYHKAGLEELNEATLSVICNGESILMQLIENELIVSNRIGTVPTDIPKPPLQGDIEKQQKKLRLPPTADFKDYTLDLRKELDLERSIFLHRLLLLEMKWGFKTDVGGKGTFKEQWRLQWDPAFSIDIIEKGNWGNTAEEAASKFVIHSAESSPSLSAVAGLLEASIPAELPGAIDIIIRQINNLSAASGDVMQLMEVIPPLVNVSRYGNVRKTDAALVLGIVQGMITRICISLPAACTAVAEDAAQHLLDLFLKLNDSVNTIDEKSISTEWQNALQAIAFNKNASPVIAGYATRLLSNYKILEGDALINAFSFAMSSASAPANAAVWIEGFLKGSGTILLIDNDLWNIVHNWVEQLNEDNFMQVLPLLRRTFAGFTQPERRKLGEKVKNGVTKIISYDRSSAFDHQRATQGIPVVLELFGLKSLIHTATNE